jgi:hypothetical protein
MAHFVPFHRSTRVVVPEWAVPFKLPVAVQAVVDVQDTATRTPPGDGLGVCWIDQRVPFHRSASVPTVFPELSVLPPTAVQDDGEAHATPAKKLPTNPAGIGAACRCQRVPSHRSEKSLTGAPALLKAVPAAIHDDPDVHVTPNRAAPATPAGSGVARMLHRVPFHRSARVLAVGTNGLAAPTAVHADADVQDTPVRAPPLAGLGMG